MSEEYTWPKCGFCGHSMGRHAILTGHCNACIEAKLPCCREEYGSDCPVCAWDRRDGKQY